MSESLTRPSQKTRHHAGGLLWRLQDKHKITVESAFRKFDKIVAKI